MLRGIFGILLIAYGLAFGGSHDARGQAQGPEIQWQKCFGGTQDDFAECIIQTSDGGFVTAGTTNSNDGNVSGNHGGYDAWVVKLNAAGAIQWQKCFGGSGDDEFNSIVQTSDGGFAATGWTYSNDGEVSGNHGSPDVWVVKLDDTGAIQWQKCLGGELSDVATSIIQTADGGFAVAGNTASTDGDVSGNHGGQADAWVVKLNDTGAILWQRCCGGSGEESFSSIIETTDGGFVAAGYTGSNDGDVSGNHGSNDVWVVKLNASGAILWQKCLGGSGQDIAFSIIQDFDDGLSVAAITNSNDGEVSGNHGENDAWVVKLNSAGSIEWQKCLGGAVTTLHTRLSKQLTVVLL